MNSKQIFIVTPSGKKLIELVHCGYIEGHVGYIPVYCGDILLLGGYFQEYGSYILVHCGNILVHGGYITLHGSYIPVCGSYIQSHGGFIPKKCNDVSDHYNLPATPKCIACSLHGPILWPNCTIDYICSSGTVKYCKITNP